MLDNTRKTLRSLNLSGIKKVGSDVFHHLGTALKLLMTLSLSVASRVEAEASQNVRRPTYLTITMSQEGLSVVWRLCLSK
jgi:hypothetical protein